MAVIDENRADYGVEPICEVLPIAPFTYHRHKDQEQHPERLSDRARRDEHLAKDIQRVRDDNHCVYGVHKVWKQLNRESIPVARCTVERLMGKLGIEGIRRGKRRVTTVPSDLAEKPLDLVNREFIAAHPNQLWVADVTYVATWSGFVYVAFVVDVFARYTERLAEAGFNASVGSVGDSYDSAFAATINGLFKAEVIHKNGPWKGLDDVERATLPWVDRFNHQRLLGPIGDRPPAEHEMMYYQNESAHAA